MANINNLDEKINSINTKVGIKNLPIVKRIFVGISQPIEAAVIYLDGISNKATIDADILRPLMLYMRENIEANDGLCEYICKRYISMSNSFVEKSIDKAVDNIKRGKSVVIFNDVPDFIIVDTTGGMHRNIEEPKNETTIRGPRDGFVENFEVNLSLIKRRVKDKNLAIEIMQVGRRTQSSVAVVYIDDIADKDIVNEVKSRIASIDIDAVQGMGTLEQLIEEYAYSIFPQALTTERPDKVIGNIMEGRIAIILEGTPFTLILPVIFSDFFQGVEDYYERTIVSTFIRILRNLTNFLMLSLPAIYLTFIKYNAELIPSKFIIPVVQSRKGVPLPPLLEIISMELVIEILREGGLRLPSKIGQTLSVVGGFIIGDAAIRTKIVSPATVVVVGVSAISTFLVPNYEMSLSIRLLRFPMLILANYLGVFGIVTCWYIIIVYLYSFDSFGIPYISTNKYKDLKDILIRQPLWKMKTRPESIPNNNPTRQTDNKMNFRRRNNEKGK